MSPTHPSPRSIVVVDDEASMRRLLKAVLEPRGHHIVEFTSGEEFLEHAATATEPPLCVLLDLHMRGMDGADVRRRMGNPGYPVFLMTGDHAGAFKHADGNFDAIIGKPIDWLQLCSLLDTLRRDEPGRDNGVKPQTPC